MNRRWHGRLSWAASLILHGALLGLASWRAPAPAWPGPPLQVRFILPAPPLPSSFEADAGKAASPAAEPARKQGGARQSGPPAGRPQQAPRQAAAGPSPETPPALDIAAVRAMARALPRDGKPPPGDKDAPSLADRPILAGLAKGFRASPGVEEKIGGGSRLIRYGKTCVLVPLSVPQWQESRIVANEWPVTNCPD